MGFFHQIYVEGDYGQGAQNGIIEGFLRQERF